MYDIGLHWHERAVTRPNCGQRCELRGKAFLFPPYILVEPFLFIGSRYNDVPILFEGMVIAIVNN